MTIGGQAFDLSPVISALIGLVALGLTWLGKKIAARQSAATQTSHIQNASLQLAEIVVTLAGKAWERLSPKVQAALADGTVTPEERAALEAEVKAILAESGDSLVSQETLSQIAAALGLPMPGLIARIAAGLLDLFVRSHDVRDPSVSSIFAVAEDAQRAEIDANLAKGG